MAKIALFAANGCEEIEALTVVDICRRSGFEIDIVSITGGLEVTSSHKVTFKADRLFEDTDITGYDGIVLPGGMPGTNNLGAHAGVVAAAKDFAAGGKLVAAICAAPSVLGDNHILEGKKATSYPGFEDRLLGAKLTTESVAVDGNVITSRGMGTAIDFSLAIVEYFEDKAAAADMAAKIVYGCA